jgi:hypothetical protein
MNRLMPSLAFGLLLVISIAIKVYAGAGARAALVYPDDDDIAALLSENGFTTSKAAPNTDPVWTYGVRDDCRLQIASVSPQGWHRSTVEWEAGDRILLYSVSGRLYRSQPTLKPLMIHYLRRLQRYVGFDAPPVRVRAIIIARECTADAIASFNLAVLSATPL